MNKMVYLKNVTTLKIDEERCSGCGVCLEVCPHDVIKIENKKARIVTQDACMECGACALNCALEAISVTKGVGCAAAIIWSQFSENGEVCCGGPGSGTSSGGCC